MSIFSRAKRAAKAKANDVVDRHTDPAKQLESVLVELEAQHKSAVRELLAFKASAKQMEQQIHKHEQRAHDFENKAMIAVKKGDDELAKKLLRASKQAATECEAVKRDRAEAAGYAAELNRTRKQVEQRLQVLKLKKGTMAAQIAAARGKGALAFDNEVFDRFNAVGDTIEDDAIAAEVQAALDGDRGDDAELDKLPSVDTDDALEALKKKMASKS